MSVKYSKRFLTSLPLELFIFIALAIAINGCDVNEKKEVAPTLQSRDKKPEIAKKIRTVTLLPYWVTSAQFAGYYVAEKMGFYKKHGIKLNIIPYQPFITQTDLITEGKTDFAVLWLVNALELIASGTDIVNIAQLSSRSSLMLIAKKKSGIKTLKDLNGKRAGIWNGFELQPKVLFNHYNLNVKIVPIGSTNNLFLMNGVDVINASWFDEYHSIINSGINPDELTTFYFADYGLNFLEDGIYCLSDKLRKEPDLCSDFINATLEGWIYAFNNPEKAIDIIVNYAKKTNQPVNRVHQRWMLDRYKDLYNFKGGTDINTSLSKKDYLFVANTLKDCRLIKQVLSFDHFYQPIRKH